MDIENELESSKRYSWNILLFYESYVNDTPWLILIYFNLTNIFWSQNLKVVAIVLVVAPYAVNTKSKSNCNWLVVYVKIDWLNETLELSTSSP